MKKFTQKTAILTLALIALSACGKNMHIGLRPLPAAEIKKQDKAVKKPDAKTTDAKKDTTTTDDTTKTDTTTAPKLDVKAGDTLTAEKLTAQSVFDLQAGSLAPENVPFKSETRNLNQPSFQTNVEPKLAFVKDNNVLFRAFFRFQPDEVKEITQFTLTLKGVRKFRAAGDTGTTLSNQVLCVQNTKICSGEFADASADDKAIKPVTDVFAKQAVAKTLATLADGSTLVGPQDESSPDCASADLVLDLRELFGLKTDKDVLDFIKTNSFPYSDGYVKLLFALGNNTYFDGGTIAFQYTAVKANTETSAAGAPTNADDDKAGLLPDNNAEEATVKVEVAAPTTTEPAATATTTEAAKPAETAAPEAPKLDGGPALDKSNYVGAIITKDISFNKDKTLTTESAALLKSWSATLAAAKAESIEIRIGAKNTKDLRFTSVMAALASTNASITTTALKQNAVSIRVKLPATLTDEERGTALRALEKATALQFPLSSISIAKPTK